LVSEVSSSWSRDSCFGPFPSLNISYTSISRIFVPLRMSFLRFLRDPSGMNAAVGMPRQPDKSSSCNERQCLPKAIIVPRKFFFQ
jgi:hypothetical protein